MITLVGKNIEQAADLLQKGELCGIPTETVYGLAGNALDSEVVAQIFEVKGRPVFDPLIVHIGRASDLLLFSEELSDAAKMLATSFWPGPLSLIVKRNAIIPDLVTSGLDTVAIRMPKHPISLELLQKLPFPLAAPSANPFGYISPTSAAHVVDQLNGKISYVLDGGPSSIGIESTIVDCSSDKPCILRLGGLSIEAIEKVIGPIDVMTHSSSQPAAPGMLSNHYSPRKPMILGKIPELIEEHKALKVGVLSFTQAYENFTNKVLSKSGDLHEAARNLFGFMRLLDESDCDLIIAESVPDRGLGKAINDRLNRASSPY